MSISPIRFSSFCEFCKKVTWFIFSKDDGLDEVYCCEECKCEKRERVR